MSDDRRKAVVPKGRVRRTMPLAGLAARTAGGKVVAAVRAKAGNDQAKASFDQRNAERYAELLGSSKGVLMKAGQMLSYIDAAEEGSDGPLGVYQAALERLQADAPPMDGDLATTIVEHELGRGLDQVFASFEREPLAAASIGQVHRATLPDGTEVAVKVQYPGVAEAIEADLANTELLATFLQLGTALVPNYTRIKHRPIARELAARMAEEVDYVHEAANIDRFAAIYRHHPFIRIPDVVHDASTARVLTMTFVEGMSWTEAQQAEQRLKDRWGEIVFRFATAYRGHGLFNADPHPGNYRFGTDGTVGFVDFGCVKEFSEQRCRQLQTMFRAAIDQRGDDMRRHLIDLGFLQARSAPSAELLIEWYSLNLENLLTPQPFTYTNEFVSGLIHRTYDATNEWHKTVTRHFDVPADLIFTTRIDLGLASVLATLRATADWRACIDEFDGLAPPTTELGKLEAVWQATRSAGAAT
jgi:predicted unusual protein kinase regulating ubiquinone biosynthesis (AarF/ABC1/UbiB family)